VAHAAEIGHALAEGLRLGVLDLVRIAVAEVAVGSGLVALLQRLAVNAGACSRTMVAWHREHCGLGTPAGAIGLVPLVAGGTPDVGVRSALDLLDLVGVAVGARFGRLRKAKRNRSPKGEPQGREDDGKP